MPFFKIGFKNRLARLVSFFKRLPWLWGEHVFTFFLAAIFLASVLGGLVAYKYTVLFQQRKPVLTSQLPSFDKESLQAMLRFWQERRQRFQDADTKSYPALFVPKIK